MSGNPVELSSKNSGLFIALSPVHYLVEMVFLNIIKILFTTKYIDRRKVKQDDFISILRTGKIPEKTIKYLHYLVPLKTEEDWRTIISSHEFPGKVVVEETFYALIESLRKRPDGIPPTVYAHDDFVQMIQTGTMPRSMLAIVPILVPTKPLHIWENLIRNYENAMILESYKKDKQRKSSHPRVLTPKDFM